MFGLMRLAESNHCAHYPPTFALEECLKLWELLQNLIVHSCRT